MHLCFTVRCRFCLCVLSTNNTGHATDCLLRPLAVECVCGAEIYPNGMFAHRQKCLLYNKLYGANCEICSKELATVGAHYIHMKKNGAECPICGFVYNSETTLRRHMACDHSRGYLCLKMSCVAVVTTLNDSVRHCFVSSKDACQYFCPKCGKGFDRKGGLEDHILGYHHVLRTSRCNECSRSFRTDFKVRGHLQNDHHVHYDEGKHLHSNELLSRHKDRALIIHSDDGRGTVMFAYGNI